MPGIEIKAASASQTGRVREHNEDAELTWLARRGESTPLGVRALLAVADGVGGHQRGEVASALAIEALEQAVRRQDVETPLASLDQVRAYLGSVLQWINDQLRELERDQDNAPPSSTLTSIVVLEDRYVVAHLGDSRAYLLRDGEMACLTDDHTFAAEQIRHGAEPDEMAQSPLAHALTRSLGIDHQVMPEIEGGQLYPGDRLLLCSDGLNEHLADEEIAEVLAHAETPDEACAALVETAVERGGRDNVTVVIAICGAAATTAAAPRRAPADRTALLGDLRELFERLPRGARLGLLGLLVALALGGGVLAGKLSLGHPSPPPTVAQEPVQPVPAPTTQPDVAATTTPEPAKVTFGAAGNRLLILLSGGGRADVGPSADGRYAPRPGEGGQWSIELRRPAAGQLGDISLERADDSSQVTVTQGEGQATAELHPGVFTLKVSGVPVGQLAITPD